MKLNQKLSDHFIYWCFDTRCHGHILVTYLNIRVWFPAMRVFNYIKKYCEVWVIQIKDTLLFFSCVFQNVNSVNVEPQPGTSVASDEAEPAYSQPAEGKLPAPQAAAKRWNISRGYRAICAHMLPAAISETVGLSGEYACLCKSGFRSNLLFVSNIETLCPSLVPCRCSQLLLLY